MRDKDLLKADLNYEGLGYKVQRFPTNKCIHDLFTQAAEKSPDKVALIQDGSELSYTRLNLESDLLAVRLVNSGITRGETVGIYIGRSMEFVICALAVLKAGAVYLPIDPSFPSDRTKFLIHDSKAVAVICETSGLICNEEIFRWFASVAKLMPFAISTNAKELIDGQKAAMSVLPVSDSNGLAYIMYTSGSTGRPKGVMIEHRGIVSRLISMQEHYHLTDSDVFLHKTPTTFDVSVWEIFWPLSIGATLVIARPDGHKEPKYISRIIESRNISVVHFVPSMLRIFLSQVDCKQLPSLRHVFCSGEALTMDLLVRFKRQFTGVLLHNRYGPTEASIEVTQWTMPAGRLEIDSVPIGIPVENVRVYLLDKGMKIVPKGEEGEIYIGGEGIARGYTNAPELTQLSFIPNPFVDGERLYKTGDLGRCGSDGNVEFLGRVDNQIKLRGMRLEPGEIESFCLDLVEIESAALVVVKQKDGNQLLVLFYKIAGCVVFNEERLRSLLREKVPDYFVPNKFISIPEMPTTSSGKIDRSRLVAHYEEGIMPSIITGHATGSMHSILYDVWKKYLSVDQFEEAADFFALGGDSFSTMNVIHEVFELYDVELAPADLFENSSFESFCSLVAKFVSFKSSSSM